MAYIFVDGCDSFAGTGDFLKKWDFVAGLQNYSTNGGRFGGGSIGTSASTWPSVAKVFPPRGAVAGTDDLFVGFSAKLAVISSRRVLTLLNTVFGTNGATGDTDMPTQLNFTTDASGHIQVKRGATVLATGTAVLPTNSWVRIEVQVSIANSGGIVNVNVNGVSDIAFTGDTFDTGPASICEAIFYGDGNNGSGGLDDVVIWDIATNGNEPTGFIGDIRIDTLRPTADGDNSDSTPLSGARWDAVNDTGADDDSTYTQANVVGNKDYYATADLADTPDSIVGVVVNARWKTTGTVPRKGKLAVKHTSEAASPALNVPFGAYAHAQAFFPQDPSTSAAWVPSGVNAVQQGWSVDT